MSQEQTRAAVTATSKHEGNEIARMVLQLVEHVVWDARNDPPLADATGITVPPELAPYVYQRADRRRL